MPPLFISPIYAAIFSAMLIYLAVRVVLGRRQYRVLLNDNGINELAKLIRAHGNFTEYVPFCLTLLVMAELNGASFIALHVLGAILVIGRLIHIVALSRNDLRLRVYGMTCTFFVLFSTPILLLSSIFMG